jgi:hypothetical protein
LDFIAHCHSTPFCFAEHSIGLRIKACRRTVSGYISNQNSNPGVLLSDWIFLDSLQQKIKIVAADFPAWPVIQEAIHSIDEQIA